MKTAIRWLVYTATTIALVPIAALVLAIVGATRAIQWAFTEVPEK